jgi:hypothetical protein
MSPEQGSGAPVDARSDVFSFGLVLYEALARRRAFAGSTELELLNEIVHSLPAPLPDDLPLGVRMVIEKALEKNPADRYQTMRDLVVDLRRATRVEMLGRPILATKAKRNAFSPIPVAAVAIAAVGTVTGWWLHARFSSMQPQRTVGIQRLTDTVGLEETPAISPDGKAIAFISVVAGKRQIWIRLLASGAPRAITKDDVDHYEPRGRPIRRR